MYLWTTLFLSLCVLSQGWAVDAQRLHWKKVVPDHYSAEELTAAKHLAVYAILANNVYRETLRRPHLPLPAGWRCNSGLTQSDRRTGLYYEVWEHVSGSKVVDQVVVAFRGSEDGRDWVFGNIFAGQYRLVDATFPRVMAQYPGIPIVALGHSLGGGLAMHCSMKWDGVAGYGFNPSSRVHWNSEVAENRREIVTERGDPLGLQRMLWKPLPLSHAPWKCDFVRGSDHFSYALAGGLLELGACADSQLAALCLKRRAGK